MSKKVCIFAAEFINLLILKIMAKIDSITIGKARGSLGNVTLRNVKGETIASQKVSKGSQLVGTRSQVLQRVRWANLVLAFQGLNALGDGKGMAQSFPQRPKNQSNFNAFLKANLATPEVGAVVLSKSESDSRLLVPAPFVVTNGSLTAPTALMATFTNGTFVMGGSRSFQNMGQLSAALIAEFGFENGDIVTFIGMNWTATGATKFTSLQIMINSSSTSALPSEITAGGVITVANATNSCAVIVRGRTGVDGYQVSPAQFPATMVGSAPYSEHVGAAAETVAVDSYGYRQDPYLQANPQ